MSTTASFKFNCKGHEVEVNINDVPEQWLGDPDTIVTVLVDHRRIVIDDIANAYKKDGKKGVELVVGAYLDGGTVAPGPIGR